MQSAGYESGIDRDRSRRRPRHAARRQIGYTVRIVSCRLASTESGPPLPMRAMVEVAAPPHGIRVRSAPATTAGSARNVAPHAFPSPEHCRFWRCWPRAAIRRTSRFRTHRPSRSTSNGAPSCSTTPSPIAGWGRIPKHVRANSIGRGHPPAATWKSASFTQDHRTRDVVLALHSAAAACCHDASCNRDVPILRPEAARAGALLPTLRTACAVLAAATGQRLSLPPPHHPGTAILTVSGDRCLAARALRHLQFCPHSRSHGGLTAHASHCTITLAECTLVSLVGAFHAHLLGSRSELTTS